MIKILLLSFILMVFTVGLSTAQSFRAPDKSPLDKAYFPDHFAHDRKEGDQAIIRVTYSRPSANGRELFGELVPYGKVWRTGADEAPEIKFYQDVTIDGKTVKAGTYSLFTIPNKGNWTVVLSKDLDYWGAYSYNEKQDVLRAPASVKELAKPVENFSIHFAEDGDNALMHLAWGKTVATLPIKL